MTAPVFAMRREPALPVRRLMCIAWPAFLMACLLEMLVFAVVDPSDLHWAGGPIALSRQGIYTLAFFVFWGVLLVSGALTALLAVAPFQAARCPVTESGVPAACAPPQRL